MSAVSPTTASPSSQFLRENSTTLKNSTIGDSTDNRSLPFCRATGLTTGSHLVDATRFVHATTLPQPPDGAKMSPRHAMVIAYPAGRAYAGLGWHSLSHSMNKSPTHQNFTMRQDPDLFVDR